MCTNVNHAQVNLYVTGGTCFLDAETNNTQVIQIIQPTEDSMCSYLTVGARGLGVALVTVVDKGLSPPSSASASVCLVQFLKSKAYCWLVSVPVELCMLHDLTASHLSLFVTFYFALYAGCLIVIIVHIKFVFKAAS